MQKDIKAGKPTDRGLFMKLIEMQLYMGDEEQNSDESVNSVIHQGEREGRQDQRPRLSRFAPVQRSSESDKINCTVIKKPHSSKSTEESLPTEEKAQTLNLAKLLAGEKAQSPDMMFHIDTEEDDQYEILKSEENQPTEPAGVPNFIQMGIEHFSRPVSKANSRVTSPHPKAE
jgi:hypothetical protein